MLNLPTISAILIFIIGIINVLPIAAFFDVGRTEQLYGVRIENESLEVLMRHRGVLLALLGAGLIYSVFKQEFRLPMIVAALVSKFVFIFLTYGSGAQVSAEVGRVALIDAVSIVVLLSVLAIEFWTNK
jgi:hypothetical protein